MDVRELLSFKPSTASKRPAAQTDHEEPDEDDPSKV